MKSAVAAGPSAPLTAVAATGGHIRITNSPWRATNKVSAAGSGGMSGDKKKHATVARSANHDTLGCIDRRGVPTHSNCIVIGRNVRT